MLSTEDNIFFSWEMLSTEENIFFHKMLSGHVFSTGDLNWVSRFTCARFSMFAKQFLSEGYYLP